MTVPCLKALINCKKFLFLLLRGTVLPRTNQANPILCTEQPNFTTPFYYVKVPKSKNELTYVQVGQKRPFTQKIRSLAQKMAILVF